MGYDKKMIEALNIFLLAMTPVGELRVAIPVALLVYNLNWFWAYFISVVGNMIPVVFLLLFLGPVSQWFSKKLNFCNKFFNWLFERTRRKSNPRIEKYGAVALITFVAIPLPLTGAWTGSIVAFLFNIPFKKAFPLIFLGVLISGVIMLLLTQTGLWLN